MQNSCSSNDVFTNGTYGSVAGESPDRMCENGLMPALIGHQGVLRELAALAASDDPPHALLFAGPEGSGRTTLALEYAKLLNCESLNPPGTAGASLFGEETLSELGTRNSELSPCGECRPCRLIAEGAHPDVIHLGPGDTLCRPRDGESHARHADSRDIRICQVRGVIDLASRYPFEARYRMIVIEPADRLYRDGQATHTLLKTLEEPPGHTVFCLVTSAPAELRETIVSRCRRIEVRPVPRAEIEAGLLERGVEPGLAALAAEESRGRPARAVVVAAQPDEMNLRGRRLEQVARVASESTGEKFREANSLAERFRKDRGPVLAELEVWESFWETRLREGCSSGAPKEDLAGSLEALNAIREVRENLMANVNARTAFELMLLSFPRVTLAVSPEEEPVAHA